MNVVMEFYRTRSTDNTHAVVGSKLKEAFDLDGAIEIARPLARSLDMPQA